MIAYTYYSSDARVIKEAQTAAESGYKIDFIALGGNDHIQKEVINGIMVHKTRQKRYRGSKNMKYFFSYLQFFMSVFVRTSILYIKNKYRLVHINNMPDFMVFSALIPKLCGAKIILDIHDPMPNTYLTKVQGNKRDILYRVFLFQEQLSARFADQIITVHEPLKKDILVKDRILDNKIIVLPNFADERIFKLVKNYRLQFPIKLVFYGTIAERFGLKFILEALSHFTLKDRLFLKIIGDGDYAGELKGLISYLGLHDHVEFDNAVYPVQELPAILRHFHIGVVSYRLSPATEYMLPVKMMELLAMGIPVITVHNKAIDYYFKNGHCLFYDPNDMKSLSQVFDTMVENPNSILRIRKEWLKMRKSYVWKEASQAYTKLLNGLIDGK